MDTPVGPPASDFTAIKGVQSYTNFFVGVQGEPGRGKDNGLFMGVDSKGASSGLRDSENVVGLTFNLPYSFPNALAIYRL